MRQRPSQLPLDLSFRPANGRDDFVVGSCNQVAVDWLDHYPAWPGPVTVLCGPTGSGKSHLLAVWGHAAGALIVQGPDLQVATLNDVIGHAQAIAVDAADLVKEPDCLFHLVNMVRERDGHLLIAVQDPPARWTFGTADMRSRLAAAPLLELGPPDDMVLQSVLLKQFDDRQLLPDADVLRFLTDRMPRTFDAARAIATRMDQLSLAERKRPTKPLARKVLIDLGYLETTPEE